MATTPIEKVPQVDAKIEVVNTDDLHFDHTYQRDVSMNRVQEMARKWSPEVAGAILVNRRPDGTLWVVDGQHRAAAAKLAGQQQLVAQVMHGLSSQQEADLRVRGNVRLPDKPTERYRAQLSAGYPETLAIESILRDFDTRINQSPNMEQGLNTVAAVEEIFRLDRGVMLVRVFELLRDTWGKVGGKGATSYQLKAIAWLLEKHPGEIDRGRLIERLRATGLEALDRQARSHRAAMGGAMWSNVYKAIIQVYNERLPEGSRLEVRTRGASRFGIAGDAAWS